MNGVCKASLSQAAGAVLGAARAVEPPLRDRPLIGMTSFGKTVLRYMVSLKPALEARGFEVAEVDTAEISKTGGGIHCMAQALKREG